MPQVKAAALPHSTVCSSLQHSSRSNGHTETQTVLATEEEQKGVRAETAVWASRNSSSGLCLAPHSSAIPTDMQNWTVFFRAFKFRFLFLYRYINKPAIWYSGNFINNELCALLCKSRLGDWMWSPMWASTLGGKQRGIPRKGLLIKQPWPVQFSLCMAESPTGLSKLGPLNPIFDLLSQNL